MWPFKKKEIKDVPHQGLQREFPDYNRPGLVYVVAPGHVLLCPFEVEKLQKKWDENKFNGSFIC